MLGPSILQSLIINSFGVQCFGDFDLWPRESKNKRVDALVITNMPIKFEEPGLERFADINKETVLLCNSTVALTFDLVTKEQNSINGNDQPAFQVWGTYA